jgi:5-methylthioadenosine/S-adenosylhomocysteine deaminase
MSPLNREGTKITAEWILPVTSPPLRNHVLEIQDGKIKQIRPAAKDEECPPGTCLIPGLINAHTHLAYTALRNLFDDLPFFAWIRKLTEVKYQKMTEEDIAVSTRLGISECLRSGITTVADLSDLEISLRELAKSPLRGIFYWEVFGVEREQADQTWKSLQEIFPRFVSEYSSSRLTIGISPHACYTVRPELYKQIAAWAIDHGIPVSFHLAESREEEEFISRRSGPIHEFLKSRSADWKILGKTSVEHLRETGIYETKPLLAHLVQASDSDLDLLADYGVSIAHCPKSNAKFGHGIAPVISMIDRGLRVGLGTDSAASNNRLDLFEESRFALFQQRIRYASGKINEQQTLEMMTINGARAMNLQHQVGSLEIGKEADLVLLRIPHHYGSPAHILNHVIYNTTTGDVMKTFISGAPVSF